MHPLILKMHVSLHIINILHIICLFTCNCADDEDDKYDTSGKKLAVMIHMNCLPNRDVQCMEELWQGVLGFEFLLFRDLPGDVCFYILILHDYPYRRCQRLIKYCTLIYMYCIVKYRQIPVIVWEALLN